MSQILKNSKIVEESLILREEIQNKIIKQEEEKKRQEEKKLEEKMLEEIKAKFMTETILIQNAEHI